MSVIDVLLTVTGALIVALAGVVWHHVTDGFRRNEKEHGEIAQSVRCVSKRIDHVIHHHAGIPAYRDEGDK